MCKKNDFFLVFWVKVLAQIVINVSGLQDNKRSDSQDPLGRCYSSIKVGIGNNIRKQKICLFF